MADTQEREVSRKFRASGDREYMQDFTQGRAVPNCESCGYEVRRPQDFGTEADGSETDRYCSVCYRNGAFVHEAKDVPDFLTKATPDIAKFRGGSVGKIKLTLKKELPKLPRWSA
jgi:hypothetical protein